jgi:ubiquinone/menaquinone biosynthesis C-methylase UbiE
MQCKGIFKSVWDFVGFPIRVGLFGRDWLPRFGWTTLEEERLAAVLPHIRGRLLDIAAGANKLVNRYSDGVGVDIHDWGGGVLVVDDTSRLPFPDQSFSTITIVAALNHILYRQAVLREARRLIEPDGQLIITMINPVFGWIGHKFIWWYGEHKQRGGMQEGEKDGLWTGQVVADCRKAGFELAVHSKFVCGMNNLYIFRPI